MDHSDHTPLRAGGQTAISDRMRELLARAAQDHVYEQRTQGAVLDEIRRRLEGMEWLLREVRERELGGLSGTLESVNGRLDDISARPPMWAEGLAQHVEAVRDHVDAVGERVGSVGRGVESVREGVVPLGELPSLWADVGAVGENVEEALVHLRTIADGTRGTGDMMGDAARGLGHIQTSMEAAAGRFTRLDKALGALAQRADRLEAGMPELSASVRETVGDAADRLLTAVEQVNGKIDLTVSRLDELADGIGGRVDRVEDRLGGIDGRLAALDEQVTATGFRVTAADTRLGEIAVHHERRFDALDERLDDIEGRAAQARSALAPVADMLRAQPDREQLTEALTRIMEPARADLTRRLGALEESMLALAEALLRPARGDKG